MNYNIAKEGITEINDTIGNVSASFDEVLGLMDNTGSVSLDGASDDIFCLDVDLGARTKIIDIRYWFTSATASGTVSGTVGFYYKDDPQDSFSLLSTSLSDSYYYATVSGVSAPRYIRLLHTLSGTAISGTATGFYVVNDDTIVDFGEDGTKNSHSIFTSAGLSTTSAVAVYNGGDTQADAQVFVEPSGAVSEYIYISDSEDGPWSSMTETPLASSDFSDGLRDHYDDGFDTTVDVSQLKISDLTVGAGKYTTKIIERAEGPSYSMLNVVGTFPDGSALKVDATDGSETYEVKTNVDAPKDFRIYSYFGSIINRFYYTHPYQMNFKRRFIDNNEWQWEGDVGFFGYTNSASRTGEEIFRDDPTKGFILISTTYPSGYQQTKTTFGLLYYDSLYYTGTDSNMIPTSSDFVAFHNTTSSPNRTEMRPIRMWADASGGIWIYYVVSSSSHVSTGYYLRYYDQYLTQHGYSFVSDQTVYDIDIVYDTSHLWVTDFGSGAVIKYDYEYDPVYTYIGGITSDDLRGVCTTDDGGCWFVNGDYDIHKLDSTAELERSITDIDLLEGLKFVLLDKDDSNFLWLVTTNYVYSYDLVNERVMFSENFQDIVNARSYLGGVALVLANYEFKFFDKPSRSTLVTLSPQSNRVYIPGVFTASYDDVNFSGSYHEPANLLVDGTASSSSQDGSNAAWLAFDGCITNYQWNVGSYWRSTQESFPRWLKYDLGAGNSACPNGIRIHGGASSDYWKRFYVQGSNNDVDWTSISNEITTSHNAGRMQVFYFNNNDYYRYFRLYFTASYNSYEINVYELALFRYDTYFPNAPDTSWGAKEWKTVSYDSHLVSPDEYKQFRITMRSDGVVNPTVDGIYLYDGIALEDINPNQYKNAYIKVDTPVDVTDTIGDYDTNLKVWWDIPINE
jgi:streptogramin lyase